MKRLYFLLTALVMMMLAVFAFADEGEYTRILSYSVDGYAGDETRLFSPDDGPGRGFYKFDIPEESWHVSGEAENVRRRKYDDIVMGCVYMKDSYGGVGEMTLTLDLSHHDVDVSEYSSMGFGIGVIGGYSNNSAYTVEVELVTTEGNYLSSLRIGQDDELCFWSAVYTDLEGVGGDAHLLNITLKFDKDTAPTQIRVSTPFLSVRTYSGFEIAEKFLVSSMKNDAGRFVGATGVVIPAEGDIAEIRGSIVTEKPIAENSTVYFRITTEGLHSGRLTFGVSYTDESKHEPFVSEKLHVDENGMFIIPVNIEGEIFQYSLTFDGIECDRTFKITSVELYSDGRNTFVADERVGELTEITRNGSSVKFSGTLDRAATKKYSGASIVFYALTDEYTDSFEDKVEIGRIKVSTRFDYTVDLAAYSASPDTYMFMAAISADGRIIPISSPAYCDRGTPTEEIISNIGLSNAAAAGAFESNAGHIIVDIPLSELVNIPESEEHASLKYTVYGGGSGDDIVQEVLLSRATLDELDRDINFYISVGIKVYLRFDTDSQITGLTYSPKGGGLSISADSPESKAMYAALVRFFSARYSDIGGFILDKSINGHADTDAALEDILYHAKNTARLCSITYNASSSYHPNATVIVPVDEFISPEHEKYTELVCVMLAGFLERSGGVPWTLMYSFDNAEDELAEVDTITDGLADAGAEQPYSVMYLYRPLFGETILSYIKNSGAEIGAVDEDIYVAYAAQLYLWVCDKVGENNVLFMEFDDSPVKTSRIFYSELKASMEIGGYIYESEAVPAEENGGGDGYSIWNFADKYHPEGWLGGGGVASCLTDYSDISENRSNRVLKTKLAGDGFGGAGIVLSNFEKTVDMSDIDSLSFTFAVTGNNDRTGYSDVSVVFVVGSSDYRAEYYAEDIAVGVMETFECDLSGYANRNTADYIGVIIYAAEGMSFELAEVKAVSTTLEKQEIAAVFRGSDEEVSVETVNEAVFITALSVVAVVTAVVIILLVRRDREDREAAEKARTLAEQKSKRSYYEKYR